MPTLRWMQAALIAFAVVMISHATAQESCYVEWSISNSYTIASVGSSYVTLNLYASTKGDVDVVAPYNLTIFNPAYMDAFSWNFEVTGVQGGVVFGETLPSNAFWETLLAGDKNVVNMGGNIETTVLGAGPLQITIDGLICTIVQIFEGARNGTPGEGGAAATPIPTPASTPVPTQPAATVLLPPAGQGAGTSGAAGTAGAGVTSGAAGTSGSTGTSGTSGASGRSGASGAAGASGTSSIPGTTRAAGTSGAAGASGISSVSGSTGTSGAASTPGKPGQPPGSVAGATPVLAPEVANGVIGIFAPTPQLPQSLPVLPVASGPGQPGV